MNASKVIVLISVMFLNFLNANLHAQALKESDDILSMSYGVVVIDNDVNIYPGSGVTTTQNTGPFYLKYEHALTDKMTIGINAAYGQYQTSNTVDTVGHYFSLVIINPNHVVYKEIYTTVSILARVNRHFGNSARFDPYWGFGAGCRSALLTYSANNTRGENYHYNADVLPLGFEITIGARYYLAKMLAIYIEAGIAKSVVQAGLSLKLR